MADAPIPGGGVVVRVTAVNDSTGSSGPGPGLGEVARRAGPGTEIHLSAGVHHVDNPVALGAAGSLVRGVGSATVLRPLNPGRPLLHVRSDGIVIQDLAIDARAASGVGRATFAVLYDACTGCRLSGVVIAGTGATSVRGMGLRDFRAERNRILDAGDDAFYLSGTEIRLLDNVAVRFLDEAADISGRGRDVILRDNCFASGRIGIAMIASRALVVDNHVEDVITEGIYLESSDGAGIVSGNVTVGTRGYGMVIVRPSLVSRNHARDAGKGGIRIEEMRGGIVQENVVRGASPGYELGNVSESLLHLNRYIGSSDEALVQEAGNGENLLRANAFGLTEAGRADPASGEDRSEGSGSPARPSVLTEYSVERGACLGRLAADEVRLLETTLASRVAGAPPITAHSTGGRQIAADLTRLWEENNPGLLAVEIGGSVMTSEITEDLYTTLRGAGVQAIGIVRAPMITYGGWFDTDEAEWRLLRDGSHVATVRRTPDGPGASITFP